MQTPKGQINDKIMELTKDEALLQEMSTANSPEECYEMVKDRLDGISFEEFQESMSVAMAYSAESKSGELSEDDLDQVAGGKGGGSDVIFNIAGLAVSAVGAAATAAAA